MRFTLALLAVLSTAAIAADPVPQIPVQTLKDVTQKLSSDEFEGRGPTTAGEVKTVAYLTERFQAAGLKPGNKGKWTQDVPMVRVAADPAMTAHFTGGASPVDLAYKTDIAMFSYREVPQTAIKASDVVFVGYGIVAPEKGWNDYAGVDVRGKTVVILVNDPDWQTTDRRSGQFNGRAMTYYGRWTYKFEEAARQGAAAAIIVHDTEPAAYPLGRRQSRYTGPQYRARRGQVGHDDQRKAIGWMTRTPARALFAAAGKDFSAAWRSAEAARVSRRCRWA